MNFKQASLLSVILTASLTFQHSTSTEAFSPSSHPRNTRLNYRTNDADADADVITEAAVVDESLMKSAVLNSNININNNNNNNSNRATTSASRATKRASPILSIESVADYETKILTKNSSSSSSSSSYDKLTILRFHAPWCKVCQTTSVAYERLAAKFGNTFDQGGGAIQFAAVNLTPQNPAASQLKQVLQIEGVPMGIFLYRGEVVGRVTLNRGNLSELKKRLGEYKEGVLELEGLLDGLMYGSNGGDEKESQEKEVAMKPKKNKPLAVSLVF